MHNLQKPIVGTLVQGWTQNPCLAAGLLAFIVILYVTVKDVATLFCSSSVKPPTRGTRPCLYTFLHILRCLKVATFFIGTNHDKILTAFMELYLFV